MKSFRSLSRRDILFPKKKSYVLVKLSACVSHKKKSSMIRRSLTGNWIIRSTPPELNVLETIKDLFTFLTLSLTHSHTMTPFDAPAKQAF